VCLCVRAQRISSLVIMSIIHISRRSKGSLSVCLSYEPTILFYLHELPCLMILSKVMYHKISSPMSLNAVRTLSHTTPLWMKRKVMPIHHHTNLGFSCVPPSCSEPCWSSSQVQRVESSITISALCCKAPNWYNKTQTRDAGHAQSVQLI
jgi:hypothetical protein